MSTYADAGGTMRDWINSRTATLVGLGNPLQKGAHLKDLDGAMSATYARLDELAAFRSDDSAEDPDMMATLAANVYGGTREATAAAAVALCEELSSQLCGCQAVVPGALVFVSDDIQGPTWAPDGDTPRMIVQFTVRIRPN